MCLVRTLSPSIPLFPQFKAKHWKKVQEAPWNRRSSWLRRTANQSTVWRSIPASLDCQMFGAGSRLYPLMNPLLGLTLSMRKSSWIRWEIWKKAGKTVLIVHHDLSKVPHYFDQVLLVNREVISFGPIETFTEANLKKLTVIDSFSMEVTYDCQNLSMDCKNSISYKTPW